MKLRWLLIVMCLAISLIPVGIIGGVKGFDVTSWFLIGIVLTVTFFVSVIISYFISKPLEKLTKTIDQVSRGELDVQLQSSEIYEINILTQSLSRVMASLKLAIHKVGVKKGEIFEETVKEKEVAEKRYEDLLSTIDEWAWETDAKGVYTFCSSKVADALGYKPEEVVGKPVFDFMPADEGRRAKAAFHELSKTQSPMQDVEGYYLHKNGQQVRVCTNAVPVFDREGNLSGYRGVHHDFTTYRPAEQKIEELILKNKKVRELRKRTPELFDELADVKVKLVNLDESIKTPVIDPQSFDYQYVFDETGRIVDCSGNFTEKLGYFKDDFLLLSVTDLDVFEAKDQLKNKIELIKKQGCVQVKTIHKRKNGLAILVQEQIEYLKDTNRFRCIVKQEIST
jgi:PAS domain S-box-containing protein